MSKISYKLYPTLLDSYQNYIDSDKIYQKYYAFSDNPPCNEDEFREQQLQSLIDRINRVPFDSEKADRGTCFGKIIDCMVENRKSETVQVEKIYKVIREGACDETGKPLYYDEVQTNEVIGLKATYNNRVFTFPISLCREFAGYFKGALTQQRVEAILPTAYGNVLVYGVIDELMPTSVHDIKTTGSYTVGKFKDHHQHLVYPYALMKNGSIVRTFEYNIVEFNKGSYVVDTYTEIYVFNPERDIPILTNHCEEFIRFLEENRELINDKKIFGGENNE
ncbi:HNH endonuclease [Bacteroides uniformis]|uniref:HNH endonuclease n=2 Tax=Bacteroides uniformis TaxID=820 RepID=UPI00186478FF|nr:HNH endonuclease [Bacteroides uniformis]